MQTDKRQQLFLYASHYENTDDNNCFHILSKYFRMNMNVSKQMLLVGEIHYNGITVLYLKNCRRKSLVLLSQISAYATRHQVNSIFDCKTDGLSRHHLECNTGIPEVLDYYLC